MQSWGRVGVIVIRRVAQDILHWAWRKGYARILQANHGNPCFMDLHETYPEPQGDQPPLSLATGEHRPVFTYQDFLRNQSHSGRRSGPDSQAGAKALHRLHGMAEERGSVEQLTLTATEHAHIHSTNTRSCAAVSVARTLVFEGLGFRGLGVGV